jgi:hypothetical protein
MSSEQMLGLWIAAVGVLFMSGWLLALASVIQKWRFMRRFHAKNGREFHPLTELTARYSAQPWLWPIEAPRVVGQMLRRDTTPLDDAELEAMRKAYRALWTTGGLLSVTAIAIFLVPIVLGLLFGMPPR